MAVHHVLGAKKWILKFSIRTQGSMWDKLVRKAARKETFSRWTAEFHLCPEYIEFGQSKLTLFLLHILTLFVDRIG